MTDEKMFPIQMERGVERAFPRRIPWSIAELAYSVYVGKYGRCQTLERLAERGGFAPSEMDMFLPDWRERVDERTELRAELLAKDAAYRSLAARFTAPIVCICGSTRFKQAWIAENARLTGEGNIVLAVGLWGHHERVFPDAETKAKLDALHLRKIDLCNWVWVLDLGGYIGESTRNEIAYAVSHGKPVRYLSKEFPDYVEPVDPLKAIASRAGDEEGMMDTIRKYLSVETTLLFPRDHSKYLARAVSAYLLGKEGK